MSDPPSRQGQDKPLSKVARRVSRILGSSRSSSSRTSAAGPSPTASGSAVPESTTSTTRPSATISNPATTTVTPTPSLPAPAATVQYRALAVDPESLTTAPRPSQQQSKSTKVPRSSADHRRLQEERFQALFLQYGLSIGDWKPTAPGSNAWVENKVVMRVYRQCHKCQKTFGLEKTCSNCQHHRCQKCPRLPAKRSREQREAAGAANLAVDAGNNLKRIQQNLKTLTVTSHKSGNEVVRKAPVQRVRRFCHKCQSVFKGKATLCENCNHQRCPACPRDPPKLDKYPDGYPGDVIETFPPAERVLKKARHRYRYACHECETSFIEREKTCRKCSHRRCDECKRHPPKKIRPKPDEEAERALEEKLGRIEISPAARQGL